jgi:hypothetical protein
LIEGCELVTAPIVWDPLFAGTLLFHSLLSFLDGKPAVISCGIAWLINLGEQIYIALCCLMRKPGKMGFPRESPGKKSGNQLLLAKID